MYDRNIFLGESHKDGNDSGDSSGDDSDFGDMEDGEEGDEGKRRKNASQQRYKSVTFANRALRIQVSNCIFSIIAVAARSITPSGMFCASSNGYTNLIFHLDPPLSNVIHPLILCIFTPPILQRKSEE